ncbi:MAG: GIY-YIG nuclease family protein [Alphaproteobacteria bacterium]
MGMYQILDCDGVVTIADEGGLPVSKEKVNQIIRQCQLYLKRSEEEIQAELKETMCALFPHEAVKLRYMTEDQTSSEKKRIRVKGFVYLLFNKSTSMHKIGVTKNVSTRVSSIEMQTGVDMVLVEKTLVDDMYFHESYLHKLFKEKRVKGEWFNLNDFDVEKIKNMMQSKFV